MTSGKFTCLGSDTLARFEALLDNLREELKIPAISAAIVKDQEVVWARGFGYADLVNHQDSIVKMANLWEKLDTACLVNVTIEANSQSSEMMHLKWFA